MKALLRRLKFLLPSYRNAQEHEMEEELAALEQFAPRREMGNLTRAAEEARAVMGFPLLDGLAADFRYAIRSLRRDKAFTAVAFLSLSIGLAGNIAIFGLMDALLWRELPIRAPEQLVSFENTSRSYFGYTEFALRAGVALEDVLAQSDVTAVSLSAHSNSDQKGQISFVSGNYFQALGVQAALGRTIQPYDDDRGHPSRVVVLSDAYWRRAFGAGEVVGHALYVGKTKFEIAGVAVPEFFGLSVGEAPDVWLPLTAYQFVFPGSGSAWLDGKNNNWLEIFGRLRSGVSIRRAQAILTPISVDIDIIRSRISPSESVRRAMAQNAIRLIPASKGVSELRERFSQPLHVIFAMLAIGLLLACVNVISLQLARADESRKEFATRLAIGAGRWRVARQCLTEMFVLAAASAAAALLLYRPLASAVISMMSVWGDVPANLAVRTDIRLAWFVLVAGVTVTLVCGLLPAIYATRQNLRAGLSAASSAIAGNGRGAPLLRLAGILQVAISLVLITGTCLFALNLRALRNFDGGVRRTGLLDVEIDSSAGGYTEAKAVLLDDRLRTRLASVAGVESASFSENGIYLGRNSSNGFDVDHVTPSATERYGYYDYVGPNFFHTLGTTILAGRDFSERDTASSLPVVIVNQTLAKRFFGNESPVGHDFYMPEPGGRKRYQIIGVVRDVRDNLRVSRLTWYLAANQHRVHPFSTQFFLRIARPRAVILPAVRAALAEEDPRVEIASAKSVDELLNATLETDRLLAVLGWTFGGLALLLASAGIYGLLSYDVARRRSEIGIRSALGAQRADVAKVILYQAVQMLGFGLLIGGAAANVLTRFVRALVFQIRVNDPRIEILASVILILSALAAAWFPVVRATRVDPIRALRAE